jgi:TRAP-type C4-dicarboxylate transport system permease small subunit
MSADKPTSVTEPADGVDPIDRVNPVDPVEPARAESDPGEPTPFRRGPVLNGIALAENILIGLLLVGVVLVILTQVFFRYALDRPLSWSTEVATGIMLYVAFVGFAIGVRDNAHVTLNLFERRLTKRGRRIVRIVELVFLGGVLLALGIGTIQYISEQSDVTTPAGIPLWTILLAIPIGSVLGVLHAIVEIISPTPEKIFEEEHELVGGAS